MPLKQLLQRCGLRRGNVAAARLLSERFVLARVPGRPASRRPRILCYHSVGTPAWGVNDVNPVRFREQLELALKLGYRFVPAERIAQGDGREMDLAITFDDGLASVADNAAPILSDYRIPWTMFVVSAWAEGQHTFEPGALLDWTGVVRIAEAGATIGSHSATHPNFGRLGEEQARDELFESRRLIEARTGLDTATFAIPFGQSANWSGGARRLARAAGYQLVYAQSETRRPEDTVPRTFITRYDDAVIFRAALEGAFDTWEEWY